MVCLGTIQMDKDLWREWGCEKKHIYCRECLVKYAYHSLQQGKVPLLCAVCKFELPLFKVNNWAAASIFSQRLADRLLLHWQRRPNNKHDDNNNEVVNNLAAEHLEYLDELETKKVGYKPCPNCMVPTTQFAGHGCHHVNHGRGCPQCGTRWCFSCGLRYEDCHQQQKCPLFCKPGLLCGCTLCPTCLPGGLQSCDSCNGTCPVCTSPPPPPPISLARKIMTFLDNRSQPVQFLIGFSLGALGYYGLWSLAKRILL